MTGWLQLYLYQAVKKLATNFRLLELIWYDLVKKNSPRANMGTFSNYMEAVI